MNEEYIKGDKRVAVVFSHNWNTGENHVRTFRGEGAALQARGWIHEDGFVFNERPEEEGWEHLLSATPCAIEEAGHMTGLALSRSQYFHLPVPLKRADGEIYFNPVRVTREDMMRTVIEKIKEMI